MAASPLILGPTQLDDLRRLKEFAVGNPINITEVLKLCETEPGHVQHIARMSRYTIPVPLAFAVTFSIEDGHPVGTCRHMSMSSMQHGRTPTPEAVWMIATELGFVGGLKACQLWEEDIGDADKAINVVQPINADPV